MNKTLPKLVSSALLIAVAALGCNQGKGNDAGDSPQSTAAAAPLPPPPVDTTPVATTPPPPPPPPVQVNRPAAAPVKPNPAIALAECKKNAISTCTASCNTKVNAKVTDPDKRRIAHDICFAECTRAADNICK